MKRSLFRSLLPALTGLTLTLVNAQSDGAEPCAAVGTAIDQSDSHLFPAELAYSCLQSVPIVEKDAISLLDGWAAFLEWQSDPTYRANPPDGYLYPGFDVMQAVADLRDRVTTGNITTEFDLQDGIRNIVFGANDGHMAFMTDFNSVFYWQRATSIISISADGSSVPEVWAARDVSLSVAGNLSYTPSQISSIDGQDVAEFLTSDYNKVNLMQDPDTEYNGAFYNPGRLEVSSKSGSFYNPTRYPGPNTTLTFTNGSVSTFPNLAGTAGNFSQVVDGPSFYWKFCNATYKMSVDEANAGSGSGTTDHRKRDLSSHDLMERQSQQEPLEPVVASDDKSFIGYILTGNEELQRTAVIVLHKFTTVNQTQVQSLLSQFLGVCREQGADHLILDITSNGGGSIIVSYDIMKQLFPGLYPYFMRSTRAQPQLEVLGEGFTNASIAILKQSDGDRSASIEKLQMPFMDTTGYVDRNGEYFPDWPSFYGPVPNNGDQYSKAFTWDISDTAMTEWYASPDYAVTGYGQNAPAPPRTFDPANIVILSDGACSSSCTTISHFLKWQAKVKSIVMGGRPQTGPMQNVGGIKGGTVMGLTGVTQNALRVYQSDLTPPSLLEKANQTKLPDLVKLGNYLSYRTSNPANVDEEITVNLVNSVLANEAANGNPDVYGGKELVPLQYIYEAADCRMFYTANTAFNVRNLWQSAAAQAFGFNGTEQWSGCVEDSYGHESSLSGDEKLFNGGVPVNVTDFNPANVGDGPVNVSVFNTEGNLIAEEMASASPSGGASATGTGGSSQETGSDNENGAVVMGVQRTVVVAVAVVMTLMMIV